MSLRRIGWSTLCAALVLAAAIDAWAGRGSYWAADSTAYMNIVSQIVEGHFGEAINGHWSPLYPLLVASFVWPVEPDLVREFAVVRLVNFIIFICTLLVFRRFLSRFADRYATLELEPGGRLAPLSRAQLTLGGWVAFAWACLCLNFVCRISADCLVVAITFATASMLLSFRDDVSLSRFVRFGLLLGLGYWAKSILFVMAFVSLAAALADPAVRAVKRRLLVSLGVFALVAAPLVAAQSLRYGHLTFSESGRLNYARWINGVPFLHWMGGPAGCGTPVHHSRLIHRDPDVYAWDAPVPVSYHPWYDPSYWLLGVRPRLDPARQAAAIVRGLGSVLEILRRGHWGMTVPLVVVLLPLLRDRLAQRTLRHLRAFAPLWLLAGAGVGVYVLVIVLDRYLAASLSILWLLALSLARVPRPLGDGPGAGRLAGLLVPSLCVAGVLFVCTPRLWSAARLIVETRGDVRDDHWAVAQEFRSLGVPRFTPVGSIGQAFLNDWHRLAEVRIVAEIPEGDGFKSFGQVEKFWRLDEQARDEVLGAFRRAGARLVVANEVPNWADTQGFLPIKNSGFFYRDLAPH